MLPRSTSVTDSHQPSSFIACILTYEFTHFYLNATYITAKSQGFSWPR